MNGRALGAYRGSAASNCRQHRSVVKAPYRLQFLQVVLTLLPMPVHAC